MASGHGESADMRIGGCTFAFGPRSLEEAASILAAFGFQTIDLGVCSNENAQVDPIVAAGDPDGSADQVLRSLEPWGFELNECFFLDFGDPVNHPDPEIRARTRRRFPGLVRFARKIGCASIMLIPGVVHAELGRHESFQLSVKELRALVGIANDAGLDLNIEACEPSVAEDPQDALRICREVPGLGLTLDYSHFVDPGHSQAEVEPLHAYARNFHIRQAAPGKRVETVEEGTIDFARIFELLKSSAYNGVVAVEYVDCDETTACGVDVMAETPKMKGEIERILRI